MKENKKFLKRNKFLNSFSLFQRNDNKFSKNASLSIKCPVIDYKNVNLLKKYITDNGKLSQKFQSVFLWKQKTFKRHLKSQI